MSIANLHETLLCYTLRKNAINTEIGRIETLKLLAIQNQGDQTTLRAQDEEEVREYFRTLFDENEEYQTLYRDYTEIPDFEEEMKKIQAAYQQELEELNAWEAELDSQITVSSTELEETKALIESVRSMLSSNIQEDFKYGTK